MSTTADEREVVEYDFECDNSELIDKVNENISALKALSNTAVNTAKATDFSPAEESLAKLMKTVSETTDATLVMEKALKKVGSQKVKSIADQLASSGISKEQKELTEKRKMLLGVLSNVHKELAAEKKRQQSAPRANYVDQQIKDRAKQSKVLKEQTQDMGKLFDEQERKQREYLKYQSEFAERLDRTQNKYNAGFKGQVNVQSPRLGTSKDNVRDMNDLLKEQERMSKIQERAYQKYQSAEYKAAQLDKTQNKYNVGPKGEVRTLPPSSEANKSNFFDFSDLQKEKERLLKAQERAYQQYQSAAYRTAQLDKTQNKYNAGPKGEVSVQTPSYEAHRDRYSDFSTLLKEQEQLKKAEENQKKNTPNVIDRMIEFQKQKAEETKRSVQDMGRLFDEQERAQKEFAEKLDKTQNKYNAGPKGQINVEAPNPDNLAVNSAIVYKEMFKQQEKAIREEAKANLETEKHVHSSSKLNSVLDKLKGKLGEVTAKARTCDSAFVKLEKSSRMLNRVIKLIAYSAVGKAIGYAAKQSISFFENLNLFNVAMGKSVDEGKKFVDQMSEVYGMDPSNLYRHAGYFYQLADAINVPEKSAAKMSLTLTKASNDIASLFNMPIERVTEDMASGMQGMTRAIRKYGMDIRVATLQQTAMNLGINQQISKMSEADRQGLRYITMMQQASNATKQFTIDENGNKVATGDFAKTIEQPANQLRILKEQLAQLGRAIGDLFIVPLSKAIQYVNAFVMALRMIITYIGAFFPKLKDTETTFAGTADKAKDTAGAISGVGNAAQKASKKLNSMLAPFDELNVLQDKTSSGGSGGVGGIGEDLGLNPEIAKAIEDMELKIENIKMKAVLARDALLQFLGFELDGNKIVGWDFDTLLANLDHLNEVITAKFPEWATYVGMFATAWFATKLPLGTVFDLLKKLSGSVVSKLFGVLKDGASYTVPAFSGSLGKCGGAVAGLMGKMSKLVSFFSGPLTTGFAGIALAGAAVFIGGFIEWMLSSDEFKGHLAKWKDALGKIFKNLKDIALAVFEAIKKAIHYCATHFDWFYNSVADVIGGLLDVLSGITEFVAGVFTGDWKRAWRGVVTAFKGIWKTVVGVAKVPINAVIGLINGMISAITSGINHCIRMINTLSFEVPDWVPKIGGQIWGFNFGYVTAPQIPKLARGGVITSPTMAMIGEGTYDEAVIPLGNSPQMSELVDRIVDATSRRDDTPVQVCVYIGDEQIAEYMHRADRRYMLQTNGGV